jgi:hypothetical protein
VLEPTSKSQGFLFRLQNDGGMNSDWSISEGNHSHLLRKGVCMLRKGVYSLKKKPWQELITSVQKGGH